MNSHVIEVIQVFTNRGMDNQNIAQIQIIWGYVYVLSELESPCFNKYDITLYSVSTYNYYLSIYNR